MSLDSTLVQGYLALANIQRDRWEWQEAEGSYRRALAGLAEDAEVHHEYGEYLLDVGRIREGVEAQRKAIARDTLSALFHGWLAYGLFFDRRLEEAVEAARHGIEINAQAPQPRGAATYALIELGRLEEALDEARGMDELGLPLTPATPVVTALLDSPRHREVLSALAEAGGGGLPVILVYYYATLGEADLALAALDEWIETQPYGTTHLLWAPSVQRLLGNDPRFHAALRRMGLEPR